MFKCVKLRLYPNKEQQQLIQRTFGCCRLVYNKFLEMRDEASVNGKFLNFYDTCYKLVELKKSDEYSFLKDVDSNALRYSLYDLDKAYRRFFRKIAKHPKYKRKKSRQTYRTGNLHNVIRIKGNFLRLPKLGFIKIKQTMPVDNIRNATVERTATGKYFVSLLVEFIPKPIVDGSNKKIGIDVGLKEFYTDSDGNIVHNPKYLENCTRKLIREQRRLARKKIGSNNREKQRLKVASIFEKVKNQRNDFLQKQTTMIVRENQTICIEDLLIKGLLRNHHLARSISSVAWRKFSNMLEYKAKWYGRTLIKVPQTYPSSQICCNCGYKNPKVKKLHVRKWECPECHTIQDRDLNASINILNKALNQA